MEERSHNFDTLMVHAGYKKDPTPFYNFTFCRTKRDLKSPIKIPLTYIPILKKTVELFY